MPAMTESAPVPEARVRKPGCTPCRERHLRCDRVRPVCSSCRRARHALRCEYRPPPLKLRPSIYSSEDPSIINANNSNNGNRRSTNKIDEIISEATKSNATSENNANGRGAFRSKSFPSVDSTTPIFHSKYEPSPETHKLSPGDAGPSYQFKNRAGRNRSYPDIPPNSAIISLDGESHSADEPPSQSSSPLTSRSYPDHVYTGEHAHKRLVTDSLDAKVFDFFVKHAGPWLDIVSPSRYFGETVPLLALRDSTLYYACLACAARVLTLRGEIDRAKGDFYEDKAIAELIPRLSEQPRGLYRETLPATTVILRMAEQFSEVRDDARCHLVGASSIFASNPDNASLGAASFWVYMRQGIRASFLNEEPCPTDSSHVLENAFQPTTDEGWGNRSTYLLARTCTACWDTTVSPRDRAVMFEELSTQLEMWRENVPDTFQAWCSYRGENDVFPIIRFISPWHVVGWQYYYAVKVLLGVYAKRPDMNMIELSRHMETEVMAPTRLLCAITFACDHVGASINGTHLVAWCGQMLSVKAEQQALLDFLQGFMNETKWPNETCCERLQRIWDGQSRSWTAASLS